MIIVGAETLDKKEGFIENYCLGGPRKVYNG